MNPAHLDAAHPDHFTPPDVTKPKRRAGRAKLAGAPPVAKAPSVAPAREAPTAPVEPAASPEATAAPAADLVPAEAPNVAAPAAPKATPKRRAGKPKEPAQ